MTFRELDVSTREWMARCLAIEESGARRPYRSPRLTDLGVREWPSLLLEAINDPDGNEVTLGRAVARSELWHTIEMSTRRGVSRPQRVNIEHAASSLARSEFNTWYVAGLARKLLNEGETQCTIYRAAEPKWAEASWAKLNW